MNGVFHSMVTQGHVSINRFLSTVHAYLGLFRSHGQRVFVEVGGRWQLLDVPSAFEIAPERCRWIYASDGGLIQVCAEAQRLASRAESLDRSDRRPRRSLPHLASRRAERRRRQLAGTCQWRREGERSS